MMYSDLNNFIFFSSQSQTDDTNDANAAILGLKRELEAAINSLEVDVVSSAASNEKKVGLVSKAFNKSKLIVYNSCIYLV